MEEKKDKTKKIIAVIVVVLLLLISFLVGIFLGKNLFNKNKILENSESNTSNKQVIENPANIDLLKKSLHLRSDKVDADIEAEEFIEKKDYFDEDYLDEENESQQLFKSSKNYLKNKNSNDADLMPKNSNELEGENINSREKENKLKNKNSESKNIKTDEKYDREESNEIKSNGSGIKTKKNNLESENSSEGFSRENSDDQSASDKIESKEAGKKSKNKIDAKASQNESSGIVSEEGYASDKIESKEAGKKSKNKIEAKASQKESSGIVSEDGYASDSLESKEEGKKSKNKKSLSKNSENKAELNDSGSDASMDESEINRLETENSEKNQTGDKSNSRNQKNDKNGNLKKTESDKSDEVLNNENFTNANDKNEKGISKKIKENSTDKTENLENNKKESEKTNMQSKTKTIAAENSDFETENSFVSSYADNEKKDLEMLNKQLEQVISSDEEDSFFNEEDDLLIDSLQENRVKNVQKMEEILINKNDSYKDAIAEINEEIEQGKKSLSEGKIDEALSHFEKADSLVNAFVQEKDDVPEAFASIKESEIASVLLENSKNNDYISDVDEKNLLLNQTKEFADKSIQNDETNADAFFILAQREELEGNYQNEIDELLQAIENDGDNYLYYFQLGKSQYRLTVFEDANLSFLKSIELKDDFYPAWFDLGLSYKKIKKYDEGKTVFEKTLDLNDVHIKSFFELAQIAIYNSDFELAEQNYKNVLKIDENNTQALLLLGTVCKIENKLAEAEFYFKKTLPLLKSEYELILTKYNLSTVLLAEIKTKEAEKYAAEAYKNAGKLEKKDQSFIEDVYYNYAFILDENGKSFDSIDIYSELLKINPDHEKTKNNLAVMMMKLDPPDTDNALALVYSVYKKNKNNFEATNNMGTILFKIEEYEKAAMFYKEAIELMPESSVVRNNLAKTYIAMGKIDDARDVYIESLKINENNYQAYIELARICFEKGDDAGAKRYLIQLQQRNSLYGIDKIEEILDSFERE